MVVVGDVDVNGVMQAEGLDCAFNFKSDFRAAGFAVVG